MYAFHSSTKFLLFVRRRCRRSLDCRRRSATGQVDLDCSHRHDNSMHLHRNIQSSCSSNGNSNSNSIQRPEIAMTLSSLLNHIVVELQRCDGT